MALVPLDKARFDNTMLTKVHRRLEFGYSSATDSPLSLSSVALCSPT